MQVPDIRIETQRLILRIQRAEDFDGFADLFADEEACRYIGGHMPRAAAWRKFLQMPGAWLIQGFGMFVVIEKSSGEYLGNIGPWQPEGWPGTEVGWALRRMAWGKGYATEMAEAVLRYAFADLKLPHVAGIASLPNVASQKVLAKIGLERRGERAFPHPAYAPSGPMAWFERNRDEWLAERD